MVGFSTPLSMRRVRLIATGVSYGLCPYSSNNPDGLQVSALLWFQMEYYMERALKVQRSRFCERLMIIR